MRNIFIFVAFRFSPSRIRIGLVVIGIIAASMIVGVYEALENGVISKEQREVN